MRLEWSDFKTRCVGANLSIQSEENDIAYILEAWDGPKKFRSSVMKSVPPNLEQTDFETNFLNAGKVNKPIEARDADSSPLSRTKVTKSGWHLQIQAIEFTSSKLQVDYSKNSQGENLNFCSMKCYDSENVEITEEENLVNAVKTVLTWEPTHDYDISGAFLYQAEKPTVDVRVWAIGVPDVPYASGGSKPFVEGGLNMKFYNEPLQIDGKAPKPMTYSNIYHTNKFSIILKHPAGHQHSMMIAFEIFKA